MSRVCQRSEIGPVLFNIIMNDLDDGAECTLSKFSDGTKLGEVADSPEGHAGNQRDQLRLKTWAEKNSMQFNKEKCRVLHLRSNNPRHQNILGATWLKSSLVEMDQERALATKKYPRLH